MAPLSSKAPNPKQWFSLSSLIRSPGMGRVKNPGSAWAKRRLRAATEPTPADLWVVLKAGRVPTAGTAESKERLQGFEGRHWDLPRRSVSSRAGTASQFPSHDFSHQGKAHSWGRQAPQISEAAQAGTWPRAKQACDRKPVQVPVLPEVGELGTLFSDVFRSTHRVGCSGPWDAMCLMSVRLCGQAPASPTPAVCGMQCTSC